MLLLKKSKANDLAINKYNAHNTRTLKSDGERFYIQRAPSWRWYIYYTGVTIAISPDVVKIIKLCLFFFWLSVFRDNMPTNNRI